MNVEEMRDKMNTVFEECHKLREAGQREYAHDESDVFANFNEDARENGIDRKVALRVFANKHWRGIAAFVRGHRSQREDVRGRINDMIVYLCLLRGMIDEEDAQEVRPPMVMGYDYDRRSPRERYDSRIRELAEERDLRFPKDNLL